VLPLDCTGGVCESPPSLIFSSKPTGPRFRSLSLLDHPPARRPTNNVKTKRQLQITGIVIGSLLTLSPLLGMLGTVIGMMRGFSVLGSSGMKDPGALSGAIGTALFSTAVGLFLCPIGIFTLVISLVFFLLPPSSKPPALPSSSTD
jgi:MotA/TolQ/ExbB proton channel family